MLSFDSVEWWKGKSVCGLFGFELLLNSHERDSYYLMLFNK